MLMQNVAVERSMVINVILFAVDVGLAIFFAAIVLVVVTGNGGMTNLTFGEKFGMT